MRFLLNPIPFFALLLISSGCKSTNTASVRTPAPTQMVLPENPVSNIAQREIVRRQERIRSADQAAIRAGQQSAAGDLEAARAGYSNALNRLPE